ANKDRHSRRPDSSGNGPAAQDLAAADGLEGRPTENEQGPNRRESSTPSPATDTSSDPSPPESRTQKPEPQPETVTRIYRPRYLSGSALHALIEPLLTPNLGRAGAADSAASD